VKEKDVMGMKLSICGKGGSGKSTLTGLLAQQAELRDFGVLVVDSDESNSSLYRTLGFDGPPESLMDLVGGKKTLKGRMQEKNILQNERISIGQIPCRYRVSRNGLSMVSIGKINRAFEGCACPMGVLNREFLKKLDLDKNEIALIDMEAGIEHFGRGIDAEIDAILLVVEPSFESLTIATKIKAIAGGFQKRLWAVINKVRTDGMKRELIDTLSNDGIEVIGAVPDDPTVFRAGLEGKTIGACEAADAAGSILDRCLIP
jgi:CO dehydrogenase maturation factor